VRASVRSPDWIVPGTLRVYQGGAVVVEERSRGVRRRPVAGGLLTLDASEDTWIVVEVAGVTSQGAFWRDALPYAATNAFFVDVAGDGWTAPGVP